MYDVGSLVPLALDVIDEDGNAVNAATVTVTVIQPDGTAVAPSIDVSNPPDVTGYYVALVPTTQAGRYVVQWVTTSPATAYTDTFYARDPNVLPIVSLAEAKAHLNLGSTVDDDELRFFLDAATELVESYTGRAFARRTLTERRSGGTRALILSRTPVLSVTTVTADGTAVTADSFVLNSAAGVVSYGASGSSGVWPRGDSNIEITYVAGYANPPAAARMATLRLIGHLWQRTQTAPHPAFSSSPDAVAEWNSSTAYAMPPAVRDLLDPLTISGLA